MINLRQSDGSKASLPHQSSLGHKKDDTSISAEEAIEEERRLAYVCVTRAKRFLHLSSPLRNRNKEVEISRFISEGMGLETEENTEKERCQTA